MRAEIPNTLRKETGGVPSVQDDGNKMVADGVVQMTNDSAIAAADKQRGAGTGRLMRA